MSLFRGACHLSSFALKQLRTASSTSCFQSWLGERTCWHRQRPRNRIKFGEPAVPVSQFVEQVGLVLLLRTGKCWSFGSWCPVVPISSGKNCVVMVLATPLRPRAANQACVDVFISPVFKFFLLPTSVISSAHFHVSVFAVLNVIPHTSPSAISRVNNIMHADHVVLFTL